MPSYGHTVSSMKSDGSWSWLGSAGTASRSAGITGDQYAGVRILPVTLCRSWSRLVRHVLQVAALDAFGDVAPRGGVARRGDGDDGVRAAAAVREVREVEELRVTAVGESRHPLVAVRGLELVLELAPRRGALRESTTCAAACAYGPLVSATRTRQRRASTRKSMARVSVTRSSGSMAGNIAMRSWLRPSLR